MEFTIIFIIFFIIIIILVPLGVYIQYQEDKERRKAYQTWAQSYNWYYNPDGDCRTCRLYKHSNLIRSILPLCAIDVVKGTWEGYSFLSFNIPLRSRNTGRYYVRGVIIHLQQSFPKILILPKYGFNLLGNILDFKDTRTESVEFSKYFTVRCRNKDFAYDFCNPRMMEYLLSQPHSYMEIELNKNTLIVFDYYESAMEPSDVEKKLNQLIQLRKLMPN